MTAYNTQTNTRHDRRWNRFCDWLQGLNMKCNRLQQRLHRVVVEMCNAVCR